MFTDRVGSPAQIKFCFALCCESGLLELQLAKMERTSPGYSYSYLSEQSLPMNPTVHVHL